MFPRLLRLPARRSALILGPRQTGKSTFVASVLPRDAFAVDLLHHDEFLRFSKDPALFRREAEEQMRRGASVVFVDEVQKIPALLDEVHGLIERHKMRFILTSSSARKLRRGGIIVAPRAGNRRPAPSRGMRITRWIGCESLPGG
jgi:predicted AAA+ superfamily ATPase